MKFSILSDIHLGPESHYNGVIRKINKNAKLFLSNFIEEMKNTVKPEFVVILGDLIQDDNSENDEINIKYIVKALDNLNCPVHYVAGNHDLKSISEIKLARFFKEDKLYYSFDSDDLHFIVLFSKKTNKETCEIPKEQVDWLKNDLDQSKKESIIFVHYGLADQNLEGNPWFEGRPEACLIENRKDIRSILEKSKKVIAVFNSHLHWDKKHIYNSIPYFTIQSLTENEKNKGKASEAYAVINVIENEVAVEIKGNYPKML